MSEVTQYPIDDPEYMMPRDAAALRNLAPRPLWTQLEHDKAEARAQELGALLESAIVPDDALANVERHRLLNVTAEQLQWMADVELHRRMNDTLGQESEE